MMRTSEHKTRFRLPQAYACRDTPVYFNDSDTISSGKLWQPEVYELASIMLRNHGCYTVVDIGCGNGTKLELLPCKQRVGVDFGSNIEWCRRHYGWGLWIELDLETIVPETLAGHFGPRTVVVCADVIEHLCNPIPLVELWRSAVNSGAILITSTPDRALNRGCEHNGLPNNPAHVREWRLDEYVAFLSDNGVAPAAAGYTINNEIDRALSTIITFHDGAIDLEHRSTIQFGELKPWLNGLQRVGGLLMGYEDVHETERRADQKLRLSVAPGGEGDGEKSLETASVAVAASRPTRSTEISVLDRIILLASELAGAQVKLGAQARELESVRRELDGRSSELAGAQVKLDAQARELESVRRELDERDERLRASEVARATAAEQVAQLRQALAERDEALRTAEKTRLAEAQISASLRAELTTATRKLLATPDGLRENLIVCMLFFNKVEQTIESVDSFVRAGMAVHLLDNGSSPEAAAQLRARFSGNSLVSIANAGSNKGVSGGRNLQVQQTTQPWLLFVDNDIRLESENLLSELILAIDKNPSVEIFVPRLFNQHENRWAPFFEFAIDERGNCAFIEASTSFSNAFPGGASIISRAVFDRLGPYDEDLFVGFEDFELAIRAWKKGQPLLVRRLDGVALVHDHRVSQSDADKASSRVRYDVDRITHSHSVIQCKHAVRLDPNFADWLREQVRQLTGEAVVAASPAASTEEHILVGSTLIPRWCGRDGMTMIVNGEQGRRDEIWLRIRCAHLCVDYVRKLGIDAQLLLAGADRATVTSAHSAGLIDGALSPATLAAGEGGRANDLGVCWYSHGFVTPSFLAVATQVMQFDQTLGGAFLHPERIIFAPRDGMQLVRSEWFDPLEVTYDPLLYPVFVVPANYARPVWSKPTRGDLPSFSRQAAMLIAQTAGQARANFGVPGSAAVIEV